MSDRRTVTVDEARTYIAEIAAREVLNEGACMTCALDRAGCDVVSFDLAHARMRADGYLSMPSRAAYAKPCAAHRPTKRYAWVADIAPEAFAAWCNASESPQAFAVDSLRVLLPKPAEPDRGGFRFL